MHSKNNDLPSFADIHWDELGQPFSLTFDDVYFSRHDGLEESRYVFLEKNKLSERWKNNFSQPCFTIAETGFGSGLNFIATWQLWKQCARDDKWLHFISIEKYPWRSGDLHQVSKLWPELKPFYQEFIAAYPATSVKGFYNLVFPEHRIRLTLVIDDIQNALDQLLQSDHPLFQTATNQRGFDAWFLDGFAPNKNTAMWQTEVIKKIANLSATNTTLATFSSASVVRRSLQDFGFNIEKCVGFGKKREMITANFLARDLDQQELPQSILQCSSRHSGFEAPWFINKQSSGTNAPTNENDVTAVIGAGLAGCQTAYALAQRGRRVILFEKKSAIASAASGAAQGVIYGKLSTDDDGLAQLNLASLLYAHSFYRRYWSQQNIPTKASGVLQLAYDKKEKDLWNTLEDFYKTRTEIFSFVDPQTASDIAGINIEHDAINFPSLGWLDPRNLCEQLTTHPNITIHTDCAIEKLNWNDESTESWTLSDNKGNDLAQAKVVVIANAASAKHFEQSKNLPLKAIRGQLSHLHGNLVNRKIQSVICGKRFIAPATLTQHGENIQTLGATFTLHNHSPELSLDDHLENISALHQQTPSAIAWAAGNESKSISNKNTIQNLIADQSLSAYVEFRCSTPDYLPIVGPVAKLDDMIENFVLLRKNSLANIPRPGNYWPGLYVNVGYGSRGLAYTPICAELLAAQICGDILPLSRNLVKALHPARFIIRDLARNKI